MGAGPPLAAPDDHDSDTVTVTPAGDVQSTDHARMDYYQNQLDAAQAQARADDAMARPIRRFRNAARRWPIACAAQDRAYDSRVIEDQDQRDDYYP